jgi:hypothetical protein
MIGNLVASHKCMLEVIQFIKIHGPIYGFPINFNKGAYLIGKCDSLQEAEARKSASVAMGISPQVIHFHPNNMPSSEDPLPADESYGVKVLGSFICHDNFIQKQLCSYYVDLHKIATDLVVPYPDLQGCMLMFRMRFVNKPVHLLRTLAPNVSYVLCSQVEELKKMVLCANAGITRAELSNTMYSSCCLSIRQGGLGIHQMSEIAPAAYCASVLAWLKATKSTDSLFKCIHNVIDAIQSEGYKWPPNEHIFAFIEAATKRYLAEDSKAAVDVMLTFKRQRDGASVQRQLMSVLISERSLRLERSLSADHLSWLSSLKNREAEPGLG